MTYRINSTILKNGIAVILLEQLTIFLIPGLPFNALRAMESLIPIGPIRATISSLRICLEVRQNRSRLILNLLVQNRPVSHSIEQSIVFPDLSTNDDLIWSLLLFSGYLTFTHYEVINDVKKWYLKIPNKEIQQLLTKLFTEMFSPIGSKWQSANIATIISSEGTLRYLLPLSKFLLT